MFYTLLLIYNTLLLTLITFAGLAGSRSLAQIVFTLLFVPALIYLIRRVYTQVIIPYLHNKAERAATPSSLAITSSPSNGVTSSDDYLLGEVVSDVQVADINKRLFLKLIGSAGLATFIFAFFKQDAKAAFFGSVPGPGTVALKDSTGRKIDPAEKGPTDGYEITQVDDTTIPSYYGFVNKEGEWYISKEGNGGEYRYIKGNTDFATAWTARTTLVYDYFNNVF